MTPVRARRRLFVALEITGAVASEVDGLRRAIGSSALGRISPHLTLVPPVNVAESDLPSVLRVASLSGTRGVDRGRARSRLLVLVEIPGPLPRGQRSVRSHRVAATAPRRPAAAGTDKSTEPPVLCARHALEPHGTARDRCPQLSSSETSGKRPCCRCSGCTSSTTTKSVIRGTRSWTSYSVRGRKQNAVAWRSPSPFHAIPVRMQCSKRTRRGASTAVSRSR